MARRKKGEEKSAEEIHREILDHLAEHPPSGRKLGPEKPDRPKRKPQNRSPRPELMLRRLRYEVALDRLETFLRFHWEKGTPEVRVVHGRGLRSREGSQVLDTLVRTFCERHPEWVHSTQVAPANEGGEGAMIVKLHPRR